MHTAAHRRLREELNFDVPNLEQRAVIDYHARVSADLWERERVHVFQYATDELLDTPMPVTDEVSATRWITVSDLRREMLQMPEKFAPWFRIYVSRWNELSLITGAEPD